MGLMKSAGEAGDASVAQLEQQISDLRKEIASLTKNIGNYGSARIDDYKAGFDRLAGDAVQASLNAVSSAKSSALSLEENLEDHVRSRPLQSIGIAVGVGFLVAMLARRH
jgi:ElaB/YqjD/DUF883 family membrane-anchored ribosome-binding protein